VGVGADLGCGGGGGDDDDVVVVGSLHAGERVASAAAHGCEGGAGCEVSGEC